MIFIYSSIILSYLMTLSVMRLYSIDNECGAVGGMRIGRGNCSTWRKPVPVPLCPLQIPQDLTWD
jgi:hypothetical protein